MSRTAHRTRFGLSGPCGASSEARKRVSSKTAITRGNTCQAQIVGSETFSCSSRGMMREEEGSLRQFAFKCEQW